MSRRILKLIALTFVVAIALSGCNLVKVDETMDKAEVVATFNGGTVTKGEVEPAYQSALAYYEYLSSYYGYAFPTDGLLETTVNALVENKVQLAKAEELGMSLTAEEEAQAQEAAAGEYEDTLNSYWDSFAKEGLTEEEIRADIGEYFAQNNYTMEGLTATYKEDAVLAKLQHHVYEDVIVTPENVQDAYNALVAADEASYSASLYSYEAARTSGGVTIAWNPEGYRTVKHILLTFAEEQQTELANINLQIADLEDQVAALNTEAEPAETDGETVVVTAEDLQGQIDKLQAEKEEKIAEYVAQLQPTIDEVMAAVEAGEDFEALIEKYNTDPGMNNEPAKTEGYYVHAKSESWVPEFRDAAMALQAIGDVSEPAVTSYGVHIIRYHSDVTAGAVPMSELEEKITESVTKDLQTAAYDEQVAKWVAEANVKIDLSVVEG